MFAFGLVLISVTPSNTDLNHILFGNVLGVSWSDVWQVAVLAVVVAAVLMVKRRDFVLYAFDPGFAQAVGLRPRLLGALLLIMLALTSVVALQIVGVVLVVAMLVIPGSTARLITDRFVPMLAVSVGVSLVGTLTGLYASYYADVSPVVPWSSRRAYCSPWRTCSPRATVCWAGCAPADSALMQRKLSR